MNCKKEYLKSLPFPVHPGYGKEEIKKSQNVVLEMGVTVCSILEKHNIPYIITNGTLIGAALYEIFVPWDDDFDLFLFDETYDQAMQCLEAELPNHLIVHSEKNDPKYFPAWNRVKNINTIAKDSGLYNPDNRLLKYPCLSVDLYRMKKICISDLENYKASEALAFFARKFRAGIIDELKYKSEIQFILEQQKTQEKNNSPVESLSKEDVYMFMVMLKKPLRNQDLFPLVRYNFEGHNFWGPKSSSALLTSLYGANYKNIPEYEQRNTRFSSVVFSDKPLIEIGANI